MEALTVRILDRDFRLACEPAEREHLLAAAAHVDEQMKAIREQGKIAGVERIAIFAALNIAGALLAQNATKAAAAGEATAVGASAADGTDGTPAPVETPVADPEILRRMQDIDALLDTALANQERLF